MKYIYTLLFCVLFLACNKNKEVSKDNNEVIEVAIPALTEAKDLEKVPERLTFTVQIAALVKSDTFLEKVENVSVYQENSLIKYRLGSFSTYEEARKFRKELRKRYSDAFVQALLNDAPIGITEALQY